MNTYTYTEGCPFQCIQIDEAHIAYVDTEDLSWLLRYEWHMNNGYVATGHTGTRMHHLILGLNDFSKVEVHHINRNPLDNRKENLKLLTFSQHLVTRDKQSNNKSGYKGVSWKAPVGNRKGAWVAQISHNKKKIHIGRFATPEEAARAYDVKAKEVYGDVALLNFPSDSITFG